jgi:hypothetical protein
MTQMLHHLIHLPPPPRNGHWTARRKLEVLRAIDAAINAGELTMETALVHYRAAALTEEELDEWRRGLAHGPKRLDGLKATKRH